MKRIVFLVSLLLLGVTASVYCEYLENPDANTLWIEDGKNISGWRNGLTMAPMEGGGFTISPGENKGYSGGRYVAYNKDYPWLVTEIVSVEHVDQYKNITIFGCFSLISNPMPGIFAVKNTLEGKSPLFQRIDLYGLKLGFKYIKQVKRPDNFIESRKVENGYEITVTLAQEAEDVSIAFHDSYCMPKLRLNNQDKLQLTPVDEAHPTVWKAVLPTFPNKTKGAMLLRATILGGGLKVPLWGILNQKD